MIRVLIVSEVRALGDMIAIAFRSEKDLEVVGCATGIGEVLPCLRLCDLALVNGLTTDSTMQLVRSLRRVASRVKVVVMGLERSQQALLQRVQAGAASYLLKDKTLDEVLQSIRALDCDEAPSQSLRAAMVPSGEDWVDLDASSEPDLCEPQSLTRREREVLDLVQQGLTNQEIAAALVIELGTVKNHVHNILRKLNVNSRRDAVRVSRLAGLWGAGLRVVRPLSSDNPRQPALELARPSLYSPALGASN